MRLGPAPAKNFQDFFPAAHAGQPIMHQHHPQTVQSFHALTSFHLGSLTKSPTSEKTKSAAITGIFSHQGPAAGMMPDGTRSSPALAETSSERNETWNGGCGS